MNRENLKNWMKENRKKLGIVAAVFVLVCVCIGGGIYVSAKNTKESQKEQTAVKKEQGEESLLVYVNGIQDLIVKKDAEGLDWLKDISYDEKKVSKIETDDSKVDVTKVGEYSLTYKIRGLKSSQITNESVKVTVVDKAKAQELADVGKNVWGSKSELVAASKATDKNSSEKEKKGEEATKSATSDSKAKTDSAAGTDKTTNTDSNSGAASSGASEAASVSTGGSGNSGGNSQPEREKVWHEPVYENRWVVEQAAWDETVSEPVYEQQERAICNQCGIDITANVEQHMLDYMHGWHSEYIQVQIGTNTYNVHHNEVGHWEQVKIKDGYWE